MASNSFVPPKLQLYSYFRSSCGVSPSGPTQAYNRGLEYEYKVVNLLKGEQFSPEFKKLNPVGFVPVLVDGGVVVADSFAIVMYLKEKYPDKPLLPQDPKLKAINIQAASVVGSGIQPLQNHSVLKFVEDKINATEKDSWVHHHIGKGFAALDELLKSYAGKYATGDEVYMADLFLAPQIHAAIHRFQIDMSRYPLLSRLNDAYNELPEFQAAMPAMQPDAPKS